MKSTLSVTLIVFLVRSGIPAAAQEPSPIAQAITRQGGTLGTRATSSGVQQASRSAAPDWSRVRKLEPGTAVIVTVTGSSPSKRYFVVASDAQLTVLNLTDPLLPATATRVLRDMASHRPEHLAAAQERHVIVEDRVRVGPDAVFVEDQKVADLKDVLQTIARTDIINVEVAHNISTAAQVVIGAAIGVAVFWLVLRQLFPRT
jgi:hypothetical protein